MEVKERLLIAAKMTLRSISEAGILNKEVWSHAGAHYPQMKAITLRNYIVPVMGQSVYHAVTDGHNRTVCGQNLDARSLRQDPSDTGMDPRLWCTLCLTAIKKHQKLN